jgi:hypothetical protein
VCETRRQEPSGDENIAMGIDVSCKETGLDEVVNNVARSDKTEIAPELERDIGEYPSLSTGVYKNYLFIPTHEGRVYNEDPRLTIPWCKINGATLSLKRLEGLVENEYVKLQLDKSTFSLASFSLSEIKYKYHH